MCVCVCVSVCVIVTSCNCNQHLHLVSRRGSAKSLKVTDRFAVENRPPTSENSVNLSLGNISRLVTKTFQC